MKAKRVINLFVLIIVIFISKIYSAPPVNWEVKGMSYASWWIGDYDSFNSEDSLDILGTVGANYAALITTWYMTNGTSSTIYSNKNRTHPYSEIRKAIRDIHYRGMKVLLKPHCDRMDGMYRGYINPDDKNIWFDSYKHFITNYAVIAEEEGVEMFCVGVELDSMSVSAYSNNWVDIINAVRSIYSGSIIYTANWDAYEDCCFWEYVDYAGIDAYFPLNSANTPLINDLISDWRNCSVGWVSGRDWVSEISNWQAGHGKPVIFGEIGYSSRDKAAEDPWAAGGTYNAAAQSNCLEAAFEVWQNMSWFKGAFVWQWIPDPNAGGTGDTDHTPMNKPGEKVVRKWYTASTVTVTNTSVNPSIVTNDAIRIVQFFAEVTSDVGTITNVIIYLDQIGGPTQPAKMTNTGVDTYRYTYAVPAGLSPDDYKISVIGYDDNGSSDWATISLVIITPAYLSTLTIYDGGDESGDTDFYWGWEWGRVSFNDVGESPISGSFCGKFIMTNTASGIAHLRDSSWSGMNCSSAERLEFWIRGTENLPVDKGVILKLFSTNTRYSAPIEVALTPNWRKVNIPVTYLTNTANGANPTFTLAKIIGIEFYNADFTPSGTIVYFDDIKLTARVVVSNEQADPGLIDNTADESVDFTCRVEGLENISKVTLDLTSVGYGKVEMTGGGGNYSYTELFTAGTVGEGSYVLPIIAYDVSGNRGTGEVFLNVAGPTVAIVEIVYDGETPKTDANWESWWGTSSFFDQTGDVVSDTYSAEFNAVGVHSGGAHIPEPSWWNGVDVSRADNFELYFRAAGGTTVELRLFSYDLVLGTKYANSLWLTGNGNWAKISTSMSFFTNAEFNPRKFVGIQIGADAGTVAYFDDIWFTANVVVKEEQVTPTLVTNIHDNIVVFECKAKSANLQITDVYIDLSALSGAADTLMTNISGWTLFRYSFTVLSNQTMGNYVIPITAHDNAGYSNTGWVMLTVTGREPFLVAIVYDGDIIPADPEMWNPPAPPIAGFFQDVDGTVTPSHGGSLCGQYYYTNAIGGDCLFHRHAST